MAVAILAVGSPLAVGDDAAIEASEATYLRLYHDPVTATEASTPIVITACASDDEQGAVMVLGYRPAGSDVYESVVMTPAEYGCYEATIPAEAVVRDAVEYYVKGEAGPGTPPAYVGHPNKPLRIEIIEQAGRLAGAAVGGDRTGEHRPEAAGAGGARPGSYAWRAALFVVLGLAILAYVLLRPRMPGLRR